MESRSRYHGIGFVGNMICLGVLAWAALGIYTSFANGRTPFGGWQTSRSFIFGLVWLFFIAPGAMHLARTLHLCFSTVVIWNKGALLLPIATINMLIQLCGILIVPIAWFPSRLPAPLGMFHGGILTGILTLAAVFAVLAPCNFAMAALMKKLFKEPPAESLPMTAGRPANP